MTTIDGKAYAMTIQSEALDFDGAPFDGLLLSSPPNPVRAHEPSPTPGPPVSRAAVAPDVGSAENGDPASRLIDEVRAELVSAHLSALSVQTAWQRRALATFGRPDPTNALAPTDGRPRTYSVAVHCSPESGVTTSARPLSGSVIPEAPATATAMNAFKALAYSPVTALNEAALALLARGEIPVVFGPGYELEGGSPDIRLAACRNGELTQVLDISRHGGPWRRGRLSAAYRIHDSAWVDAAAAAVEIAWQAAQVFAMQMGLHLCLAGTRFHAGPVPPEVDLERAAAPTGTVILDIVEIDLIPRPWLRVGAELQVEGEVVARVRNLVLEISERPGQAVGPERGGVVPRLFGRRNAFGEPALLSEFHMTHSARGDLGIALGPEFAAYTGRRATRMPTHGLQLCDRVMAVEGTRRDLSGGRAQTEYDSPADSWYYRESGNASMPNVVYMETSLQSALLLGYFLGATLTAPEEDYSLRNLDGVATVVREVDLRDKTIRQTSRLLNTTVLVGAVLQSFAYDLSVDGEVFYTGESLFGFFNETALANQNGLDNGDYLPPWLDDGTDRPPVRTIDVAARRVAGRGIGISRDHLALLDSVDVVDRGGKYAKGYLRAVRSIVEEDWFFAYHFHLDPVMPGSLGVEAVVQAMQEWAVDTGLADGMTEPRFVLPTGLPMRWRYRGQILATDREMTLEVHIKSVDYRRGRIRVVGEASVWKPGLRIYEIDDIAVELRDAVAESW
ncbi:beta-hydroxydecanoyl-ACP dehydratase [Nocardia arizonensis]|uniref:beta-hydroxydecanoyl-ACP dehydratase n=1 Tax=Nocardia arizonensis TaxID=1141647 RepID=UPI0006D25CD1|nr:beta-hydroxydecanoyl-ACP dehydratase [Nocardia arizonensis]